MIEIKMTNEEKVRVHLNPLTSGNHPATIDGKVNYEVTEGDVTVDDSDNLNPVFISGNAAAESKITATADADLGDGVVEIEQQFSVVVSLPEAKSFGVTVDAPEPK